MCFHVLDDIPCMFHKHAKFTLPLQSSLPWYLAVILNWKKIGPLGENSL